MKFAVTVKAYVLLEAGLDVDSNRRGTKGFFEADTMKGLREKVARTMEEAHSKEIVDQCIWLEYSISTYCRAAKLDNGEIVPNRGYDWTGEAGNENTHRELGGTVALHSTNKKPYGLLVYVSPVVVTTMRYKSGREVEKEENMYRSQFGQDALKKGPNLRWIHGITCMAPPRGLYEELKRMRYTEERAGFFVDLVKAICVLSEKVSGFIEPEDIDKLLATGGMKLLGQ
jgi:hypothetical protein